MHSVLNHASRRAMKFAAVWAAPTGGLLYFLWVNVESHRLVNGNFVFFAEPGQMVVFALLAMAIALAIRLPLVSLALLVAVPLLQVVGWLQPPDRYTWPAYFAGAVVAVLVGLWGSGASRYLALPAGAAASALAVYCMVSPSADWHLHAGWFSWTGTRIEGTDHPLWTQFITLGLAGFGIYAAAWAIGVASAVTWQNRSIGWALKSTENRLDETDLELRLAEDRARISREVHDTLAHSLAIVVSQAEGAMAFQRLEPGVAEESLHNIAAVSRTALIDVRRLVEQIQDDEDVTAPKPTTADIDPLISQMREVGMDASLRVLGAPAALEPSQDIAVFRIVQESLTNTLKHAGPASAVTVTLDWRGQGLALLVASAGGTPLVAEGAVGGRGVGIAGMKERARLAGGWLTAERSHDDGAFVVTAFIPEHDSAVTGRSVEVRRAEVEPSGIR